MVQNLKFFGVSLKKHTKLIIALILGIVLGSLMHPYSDNQTLQWINHNIFQLIGQIFLKLIFMVVVPMVVSALILGVYELVRENGFSNVAKKTLLYTLIASSLSVVVGLGVVNIFQPGKAVDLSLTKNADQTQIVKIQGFAKDTKSARDILLDLIPSNPIESATKAMGGEMLALMIFALIFGIAYAQYLNRSAKEPSLLPLLEDTYATCMRIVEYALYLAPIAVFCIIFNTSFKLGPNFLSSVFFYCVCVILGLLIQQFVVYGLLLKFIAKKNPWEFFKNCKEVYLFAFSTASSNATLPKALEVAEKNLKLSPKISRFVLTVGATANQNGTALFEGVTVLFLAQAYNVPLTVTSQIFVIIVCILAGIGTAGVPGGSLPVIMLMLESIGVPAEGMALILGVDRFLDMCRTTLNVSGDLVIAQLVDEKEY